MPRPTREDYKAAARAKLSVVAGTDVPLWANVQAMADGGAFVECVVWISDADVAIAKPDEPKDV